MVCVCVNRYAACRQLSRFAFISYSGTQDPPVDITYVVAQCVMHWPSVLMLKVREHGRSVVSTVASGAR